MVDWLFANVFYALAVPLILVFFTAWIILGTGRVRLIRLARDFQVCLYCTALLGATKYDVNMALRDLPDDQLRETLQGAATLDYALMVVLLVSAFFYGVSACIPYFSREDPESLERDKLIVVASACSVGMTVLFVVMARIQVGLL